MAKNKRLGVSVFLVLLTVFLVLSVIFTFSISYMFSTKGLSGKLFGKYVYVMETADMEPEIAKGAAVISDEDGITVLVEGNVILFKNKNREDVMRIRQVIHNTDNTVYQVSPDADPTNLTEVSKDKVIAKCVTEGKTLGGFISFLSSIGGIILFMVIPCIAILALLIRKILSMKNAERQEYYADPEEDDPDDEFTGFNGHQVNSPLFDPEADIEPGEEFERKKSSIAKNFKRKPGAAPQKPSRDDAPKEAVKKFKAAVEEKPNVPVARKATLVPESENPVQDEKLNVIKSSLIKQDSQEEDIYGKPADPDAEKTVAFRPVHQRQTPSYVRKPIQQTTRRPQRSEPKRSSSPRNENINSIDDLIKALEEEKKKL